MISVRRAFGTLIPIPIPPEFLDEPTLLAYLTVSPAELKKIWWYNGKMYKQFNIAKGSGKLREITAPDDRLKFLQRKLAPLLNQLYRVRNPVHGFVPNRSVKTNAEAHGNRYFVLNLDLKDFFPSITENRIRGLLRSLGVEPRVSDIVTRLCSFAGHLPQGAPTSPVLSNMICFRLDTELLRIAKQSRAIYTRYADDITFSSYQPPAPLFEGLIPAVGRFAPELLSQALRSTVATNGFEIHDQKAHYANRNSRRIVTGVKINAGLNVDRRYVRQIRAVLHSIESIGLAAAQAKHDAASGNGSLPTHLRGKISYIAHLKGQSDPVVRALAQRYNGSFPTSQIRLTPTGVEKRDRSVWIVEQDTSQGTAFFLNGFGLVTAAHCVAGSTEIEVYHPSKPSIKFKVSLKFADHHRDLALLDYSGIPVTEFYEIDAAATTPTAGEAVASLGYPDWGPGKLINIRGGAISSIFHSSAVQKIDVTQQIMQGMSGGPLVNAAGNVIGVNQKGGPNEGWQLAIHVSELKSWLLTLGLYPP